MKYTTHNITMNHTVSLRTGTFCSHCLLTLLILLIATAGTVYAENKVTCKIADSIPDNETDTLDFKMIGIATDNDADHTRIFFSVASTNTPFNIYKVEWVNGNTIYSPLEPFTLNVGADEIAGKKARWRISLDFPFSKIFNSDDVVLLHTDRGVLRSYTSRDRHMLESIKDNLTRKIDSSTRESRRAWTILAIILVCVAVAGVSVYIIVRRRFIQKRREIEELSMLITDRTKRNHELEARIDALYGSRLDTLNMLCNEYFEKNDSEKVRLTLYNEVEKHILALRDSRSIAELEKIVNTFLDNILVRVQEQIPELNRKDILFLTYLYAGFSPRAVCIFTDLKIKNFYNRRSRLKERILASTAPDREFFASKM